MLCEVIVTPVRLERAIQKRHHAMERFYDIDAAARDRDLNLELLDRVQKGTESQEDHEAAIDIIRNAGI